MRPRKRVRKWLKDSWLLEFGNEDISAGVFMQLCRDERKDSLLGNYSKKQR